MNSFICSDAKLFVLFCTGIVAHIRPIQIYTLSKFHLCRCVFSTFKM